MKTKLLLSACVLTALYGCQSAPNEQKAELSCVLEVPNHYSSVLSSPQQGWSECFNHKQAGLFESVVTRIHQLASESDSASQELNALLYYLRAYAYYTDLNELTSPQWDALNSALHAVTLIPNAEKNTEYQRTLEHLFVAIYQYSAHKNNEVALEFAIAMLTRSIHLQSLVTGNVNYDYQLLELYRSIGFLAYEARTYQALRNELVNSTLADELMAHITRLNKDDWRLQNALWALASLHYLLPEEQQAKLDQQVETQLFEKLTLSKAEKQTLFSHYYLANSYRFAEQCEDEFKGKCLVPGIDDVLPINHQCSETLFIRATSLNETELANTCQRLTSQESFFHQTLATNNEPVADDYNTKLRVVIFDNYSNYNRWGQLLFNINTPNGGMFIEGDPSKKDNQATFYAFEAFWQQPSFSVWNLNHEYVHYLDGRYVAYGPYGHYPDHIVWWSEGLAEYISAQQQNDKAFAMLNQLEQTDWPSLAQIFATTYNDGVDHIYRWSYLAIRFIFESQPEQGQAITKALKNNDFDNYKRLLNEFASAHQGEFAAWLQAAKPESTTPSTDAEKVKRYRAQPLYRYLYRSYLRPAHLPIDAKHYHFSNWG